MFLNILMFASGVMFGISLLTAIVSYFRMNFCYDQKKRLEYAAYKNKLAISFSCALFSLPIFGNGIREHAIVAGIIGFLLGIVCFKFFQKVILSIEKEKIRLFRKHD